MEQNDTSKSITQSRHDSPWQKFLRTGSVEDYLAYKKKPYGAAVKPPRDLFVAQLLHY